MKFNKMATVACLAAAAVLSFVTGHAQTPAQGAPALSGVVSSQAEGKMEGVLVTARREGANFDVTVVSDASGRYSFPASHLGPGTYNVTIRAVGYELPAPVSAAIAAGKTTTTDLKLRNATDMSRQLTSVEWSMNIPGSDLDKDHLLRQAASCAYCHNVERIIRSTYTAEQFPGVITRMQKYYLDGSNYSFEGRGRAVTDTVGAQAGAEKNPNWGYWPALTKVDLGKYLATLNKNGYGKNLPTSGLKTLPRPKGAETKVIITQYDMPRRDTVAHDGDIDKDGNFWYSDQSALFLGRLDAKTGTFKEWAAPETKKRPAGVSDVMVDPDGYVWVPVTSDLARPTFGMLMRFDPKAEKFEPVKNMPEAASVQFMGYDSKGKIWGGFGPWYRIDRKTNTYEATFNIRTAPNKPADATGGGYQSTVDSQGNPLITDFMGGYIVKMNGATKEMKFFKVPTKDGMPRRGRVDPQDRFWFSEYRADKIGMFDSKAETIREYEIPMKYFTPYTVSYPDKRGRVFSGSNTSDRLARIDTKTGNVIMYLMPTRDFDTKKISIDPTNGTTVWFANKRSARVVKVEQLD